MDSKNRRLRWSIGQTARSGPREYNGKALGDLMRLLFRECLLEPPGPRTALSPLPVKLSREQSLRHPRQTVILISRLISWKVAVTLPEVPFALWAPPLCRFCINVPRALWTAVRSPD